MAVAEEFGFSSGCDEQLLQPQQIDGPEVLPWMGFAEFALWVKRWLGCGLGYSPGA
jgi:hypothetical protein